MIIIAVASGTSADGLDVGVFDVTWRAPREVGMRVLGARTEPWPDGLAQSLLSLLPPAATTAAQVCELDTAVGQEVGRAARRAMRDLGGDAAELVVSPGQTVYHDVRDGRCRGTLQLGQPAWVVEATGLPVVSDLRARDVSAGGHGAPLASTFDGLWLAGDGGTRAALNLGGIANVTVVGDTADRVLGWDTGPANCLIDVAASRVTGGTQRCDRDGRIALAGRVRQDLLEVLLRHPHFARTPPVSTGREAFSEGFLDEALAATPEVTGEDLLATLTELTALSVARALREHDVVEVVVSGGGTANPALMAALRRDLAGTPGQTLGRTPDQTLGRTPGRAPGRAPGRPSGTVRVVTSDERGLGATAKETAMWALQGFLTWHGVPGATGATGARTSRVLGRISPGDRPLVLPTPAVHPPRRLHLVR